MEDLRLKRLPVVYPGKERYRLGKRVDVFPLDAARGSAQSSSKVGEAPNSLVWL